MDMDASLKTAKQKLQSISILLYTALLGLGDKSTNGDVGLSPCTVLLGSHSKAPVTFPTGRMFRATSKEGGICHLPSLFTAVLTFLLFYFYHKFVDFPKASEVVYSDLSTRPTCKCCRPLLKLLTSDDRVKRIHSIKTVM